MIKLYVLKPNDVMQRAGVQETVVMECLSGDLRVFEPGEICARRFLERQGTLVELVEKPKDQGE